MVTAVETGLNVVLLLEASVDEPDADTVIEDADVVSGPEPLGHTASAVGVRHNCGASPITLIVVLGAVTYVGSAKVTRKSRLPATHALPPEPPDTGKPARDSTPLSGMATSDHPASAVPDGSSTLSDADDHFRSADPTPAIRKSTHSWIPEFAEHAILGTDALEGNWTVGEGAEQPSANVLPS